MCRHFFFFIMIKNFLCFKEIKPLRNFTYKTSDKFNWALIWRWCLFCWNSFHCAFVHKEVRCTNKTEIKDGLQYTNKKLSLLGYNNILYTWGFNNELETVHFLNHSVFLKIVFLYCMKDQCKTFSITSQAMHFNFPVLAGSLLHLWYISRI